MRIERTVTGLVIEVGSPEETDRLGAALAEVLTPGVVVGLVGPLGAGKTRLVRAVAESLGADPRAIASPTFMLIHEYGGRLPVFHFDTYRLASADDFEALGATEYFAGEGVCLVEWADRVADLLPPEAWSVRIEPSGEFGRRFLLELPGEPARLLIAAIGREVDGG